MDCNMPILDGLEATRKIRDYELKNQHEEVKIIALTANIATTDEENCLDAGINKYLKKPVKKDVLLSILQNLFCCE